MFRLLGEIVSRRWALVLLAWAALMVGLRQVAPRWEDVTHDGDFAYLPGEMTSVRGEKLLAAAFPDHLARSQIALVLSRPDGRLLEEDFHMADQLLEKFTPSDDRATVPEALRPISTVWSYESQVVGRKLVSPAGYQGQAMLIVLQLRNEFMAIDNMKLLAEVYATLDEIRSRPGYAPGLELGVTGSAAIGTDMLFAAEESIRNTNTATIVLVVVILLLVYRAPGLVLAPLLTIAISLWVAVDLVALLSQASQQHGWFDFKVFKTTKIFIVVILFGSGTDYCLFLISRFREELRRGLEPARAMVEAMSGVGGALAASALTTIVGLGTMVFADFGKFRNSGPAIALCLLVALLACLTLTPALLRAGGWLVFWPFGSRPARAGGETSAGLCDGAWRWLARGIMARPGLILVVSLLLLAPLAWKGIRVPVTYDLLNELKPDRRSVQGTRLLQRHFLTGETGPVTVLAHQPAADFTTREGLAAISHLTKDLYNLEYVDASGKPVQPILSVRSLTEPLGDRPGTFMPFSAAGRRKLAVLKHPKTKATFLSQAEPYAAKVARFDLVFQYDPFSREATGLLDYVQQHLEKQAADPQSPWYRARFDFVGTTAGIRDLETVTTSDRVRIQQLVVLAVLGVLVLMLGRLWVCTYLVLSVLLGYFVTIGITEMFFQWLRGETFHGLDWKVPIFLFVLLVAAGADYTVYLTTRVFEEQRRWGPRAGLQSAIVNTGGIITSCGIIMAGTFAAMISGTLRAMQELGFALALGVLLDTFLIRTILVPAFLALLSRREHPTAASPPEPGKAHGPRPARRSYPAAESNPS